MNAGIGDVHNLAWKLASVLEQDLGAVYQRGGIEGTVETNFYRTDSVEYT
jgi:hypothetical protein